MTAFSLLLMVILGGINNPIYTYEGIGTVFSANDVYNPNPINACTHKKLVDKELVIAHRTLPCGEEVIICNKRNLKCTTARVADRGPYGTTGNNYTSIVDLSEGVKNKIEHNGFEEVFILSGIKLEKDKPKKRKNAKDRRVS